jgi:hypothetical protein
MNEERRIAVVIVLDSPEAFRKFLETAEKKDHPSG